MTSAEILAKLGGYIVAFFLIIAAIVWLFSVHPVFAGVIPTLGFTNDGLPPSFSLSTAQFGTATTTTPANQGIALPDFETDGVVFIDLSSGNPGTPYLLYKTGDNDLAVKELIFARPGEPLCQVSAGEYPCAPDNNNDSSWGTDVSPVPSGTPVHVVGGHDAQAVVVQNLQTLSTLPSDMVEFATPFGGSTSLTNGLSLHPTQLLTNQSCTLFVGCYGPNTTRLVTTLNSGRSTSTTELIPGNIMTFGHSRIVLLSVDGAGSSGTAHFLVAQSH